MSSDSPTAWLFGFFSHIVNSVLLVLLWACLVLPNLSPPISRVFGGFLWGEFLALTLSGALVAPMSGLGLMGWRTGNLRMGKTSALLHGLWGTLIGLIYVPR